MSDAALSVDNERFRNKYRIPSSRLKDWNYAANGAYFITICNKYREYTFGEVAAGKMILSDIGKAADELWKQISALHDFIVLDEWVIMPNHIHGIITTRSQAPAWECNCS